MTGLRLLLKHGQGIAEPHFALASFLEPVGGLTFSLLKITQPLLGDRKQIRLEALTEELALDPQTGIVGARW